MQVPPTLGPPITSGGVPPHNEGKPANCRLGAATLLAGLLCWSPSRSRESRVRFRSSCPQQSKSAVAYLVLKNWQYPEVHLQCCFSWCGQSGTSCSSSELLSRAAVGSSADMTTARSDLLCCSVGAAGASPLALRLRRGLSLVSWTCGARGGQCYLATSLSRYVAVDTRPKC